MSTYVIGDVQGCFQELLALVDRIHFKPGEDTLWFTGDLVNRGPQSLEVLRWVKNLGTSAVTVLGNHDLHLLAVIHNENQLKPQDTLGPILAAPDRLVLAEWLRHRPILHYDAHYAHVLVHAGLAPEWDLITAQTLAREIEVTLRSTIPTYTAFLTELYGNEPDRYDPLLTGNDRLRCLTNYFTRLRYLTSDGRLLLNLKKPPTEVQPTEGIPWFRYPQRQWENTHIVFGHWAALMGETQSTSVHAVDTGCVWGHRLTALRLEDQQRFSVEAYTSRT